MHNKQKAFDEAVEQLVNRANECENNDDLIDFVAGASVAAMIQLELCPHCVFQSMISVILTQLHMTLRSETISDSHRKKVGELIEMFTAQTMNNETIH